MIERIIQSCLRHRLMVLIALAGLVFYGVYASLKLQVDAFPDVTNVQVQVYTTWPGMSPEEVEKQVTFPIEVQMAGLPDMVELRSVSRFGLSLITVVFADQVDLYFARQLVLERLIAAKEKLPKGVEPVLGPIATGLSEIYQYTLEEENAPPLAAPGPETARLMRLRTIQDAIVRPFLKTVPGVTDINSFGGFVKQYQVQVDPDRLRKFDLSLKHVFGALAASNANAGGNVLERGSEQALVRGLGLMQSVQDIEAVVLKAVNGTPVLVKDVATVSEGPASRWGAVLENGKREAVAGIVLMIRGGSGREVVTAVKEKVAQLNAGGILPKGVTLKAFYDRTGLVRDCINTVSRAIAEGVLLVILVVYLFLRSFRGALIIALTLPLVALATFITMRQVGLSANLMSLGGLAISIGMIVDSAIIQVENVMHHLGEMKPGQNFGRTVLNAVLEVRKPSLFGELIIALTFLPIMTLQGMEGKMFAPLAFTVVIALLASLVLSIVAIPSLCSYVLKPAPERVSVLVRAAQRVYRPVLALALDPIYVRPLGAHPHVVAGLEMSRYLYESGASREQCAHVVAKNRGNALFNDAAGYGADLKPEEVLQAAPAFAPLSRLDAAAPADGAVVVVLASEARARALDAESVWVLGAGWCTDSPALDSRRWDTAHYAHLAAQQAYRLAGISTPSREIDFAEVDDTFSYKELQHLEALGLFRPGEAGPATVEGLTALDGDLPVNPSGGSLGVGHLGEATGLYRLVEAVRQLRGEAGPRQLPDVEIGLAQSWRGVPTATGAVVVLGTEPEA